MESQWRLLTRIIICFILQEILQTIVLSRIFRNGRIKCQWGENSQYNCIGYWFQREYLLKRRCDCECAWSKEDQKKLSEIQIPKIITSIRQQIMKSADLQSAMSSHLRITGKCPRQSMDLSVYHYQHDDRDHVHIASFFSRPYIQAVESITGVMSCV